MPDPAAIVAKHRLFPVVVLEDAAHAEPLADALVAGGLPVAEVTFRTDAAADAIRKLAARSDLELVGAGTVLTPDQADAARDAGAEFVVTPGFSAKVVTRCQELGLPVFPGVATPTDIALALEYGLDTLKFFPAEAFGGLATLKAIAAPYRQVRFFPTGGVSASNLLDYLRFPKVVACGGSWMVKPALFADGDFSKVEQATREAVQLVASLRDDG